MNLSQTFFRALNNTMNKPLQRVTWLCVRFIRSKSWAKKMCLLRVISITPSKHLFLIFTSYQYFGVYPIQEKPGKPCHVLSLLNCKNCHKWKFPACYRKPKYKNVNHLLIRTTRQFLIYFIMVIYFIWFVLMIINALLLIFSGSYNKHWHRTQTVALRQERPFP